MNGPVAPDGGALDLAVVLPCRDVEATLAEQLDALTAQAWSGRWTIVVVDNGSTDGTASVARTYADSGVTLVEAQERSGIAYARNSGVASVVAATYAFCDGDDVVHPGWVAAMGEALSQHDLVGGSLDTTSLNPSWLATTRPFSSGALPKFGGTPFVPGCTSGISRRLHDELAGYDEEFWGLEDMELSLRAHALGVRAHYAPAARVSYRLRSEAGAVWRQGLFYGRTEPLLRQRALELGLPAPSRWRGVRSWGWLLLHLPRVVHRTGRFQLWWVLSCRAGALQGAFRLRSPHL